MTKKANLIFVYFLNWGSIGLFVHVIHFATIEENEVLVITSYRW